MCKTHQRRSAFGSLDIANFRAAVARRTFVSQNVKKNNMFGPFFDVRMSKYGRKMARHCGAKHIDKSKCKNTLRFAPLLEVALCEFTN